jgi:hypothetical protein
MGIGLCSPAARVFGEEVRARREVVGVSKEALADGAGARSILRGKSTDYNATWNLHNLLKVVTGLRVNPTALLRGLRSPDGESSE